MEMLAGETLAQHARHRFTARPWSRDDLRTLLRLIAGVCDPLAALHEAGIVHRDLKPDNVVVRPDGSPVIVDLGLARDDRSHTTRASVQDSSVAGTLAYMAPEQHSGELVDGRTDLYALGCILFELLVGHPPADHLEPPSRRAGELPIGLDALVLALLQPRPRDRIGRAEDVVAWIQTLEPSLPTGPPPAAPRRLYRPLLAGRADLVRELAATIDRLPRGRGAFVLIEGEAGIGKSHLASELGRRAAAACTVVPAASEAIDGAPPVPLACWRNLFEQVADRATAAPASAVAGVVSRHLSSLLAMDPTFGRLSDPRTRASRPTPDEVIAVLRDLVAALAVDRPVVILLDDLQWADDLTLGVLRLLDERWLSQHPVLLVAMARSDEVTAHLAELRQRPGLRSIALAPLATDDLRELVADMLGVADPSDAITAWIAERAEGNPFLAAEHLRLLVTELPIERELVRDRVQVRVPTAERLASLPSPGSVRELVMRRLRLLDEPARDIAELFAVLGGVVDAATAAILEEDHRDQLFDLHRTQVIEPTEDGGRRLLHDRVRAIVVGQLALDRRRALHRRAARLLVRAAPDAPPFGAVAHHLEQSGQLAEAVPNQQRAGELALSRAGYEAAARHFGRACELAVELARQGTPCAPALRAAVFLGAARATYGRGEMDRCEAHVREALALIDRRLPARPLGWLALAARETAGRLVAPIDRGDEHRGLVADVAVAASMLPYRYFFEEDLVPLVGTALLAANLLREAPAAGAVTGPTSMLAAMAGLVRLSGVARRYFDEAHACAERSADWRAAAEVAALESVYHGSFGRWDDAEVAGRRAETAAARTSDPWLVENVDTTLAHVEYFTGRFVAAHARATRIEHSARDRQDRQHQVWGLFLQARSDIPRGRWAAAADALDGAEVQLAVRPELLSEVACRGLRARVLLARGDTDGAEAQAAWVSDAVWRRPPTAYPSLIAYTSAAHVLRRLVAATPTASRRRAAGRLAISLWRFAALFPVARPAAYLHTGELLRLAGAARLARACLLAGARHAARTAMPYERGLLLRAAARVPSSTRAALASAGRDLLTSLGCDAKELDP